MLPSQSANLVEVLPTPHFHDSFSQDYKKFEKQYAIPLINLFPSIGSQMESHLYELFKFL